MKSLESIRRFRASEFDMIKAGLKKEGEVVSVNMVYSKAGTPSPTVSQSVNNISHLKLRTCAPPSSSAG